MSDIFEHDREGGLAVQTEQGLKSGPEEGERAGGIGISQEAGIFPPQGVSLPMAAFAAPMVLDFSRHHGGRNVRGIPAGDEEAGQVFRRFGASLAVWPGVGLGGGGAGRGFGWLFGGRAVAGPEELPGLGEDGALRIGVDAAELALDGAPVAALGGRKRGVSQASFCSARWRSLG